MPPDPILVAIERGGGTVVDLLTPDEIAERYVDAPTSAPVASLAAGDLDAA